MSKRPVIVWVDEGTEEILVEEYESVSDGELTTATHMELTHDQIVPVPSRVWLRDVLVAIGIALGILGLGILAVMMKG